MFSLKNLTPTFLVSYDKTFKEKWSFNISAGGNQFRQKQDYTQTVALN
jgi:hypothetical protein